MPLLPANSSTATAPRLAGHNPSSTTSLSQSPYKSPTVSAKSPRSSLRLSRTDSYENPVCSPGGSSARAGRPLHLADPFNRPSSAASSQGSVRTEPPFASSGQHPVRPAAAVNGQDGASSSKFFHASDAKTSTVATAVKKERARPPVSNAKFFYAEDSRSRPTAPSTQPAPRSRSRPRLNMAPITAPQGPILAPSVTLASPVQEKQQVKFVYANGFGDALAPSSSLTGSSRSTSPTSLSPARNRSPPKGAPNLIQSPPLLSHHQSAPVTHQLHHNNQQQQHAQTTAAPPPPLQRQNSIKTGRRQSIDTTPRRHGRAQSVGSFADMKPHMPTPPPPDLVPPRTPTSQAEPPLSPKSPTTLRFSAAAMEKQKELAEAARRERKVLDLEISNASLLAINRTLEKRMRKQMTEIRRFRRLSRSGKLSLLYEKHRKPVQKEDKENSSKSSGMSENEEDEEEEEEEEDDDEDDDDEDLEDDNVNGDPASKGPPKSPTEKQKAQSAKDEKKLATEISKHQSLLDASAKMNESLKRCHFVTETLIEEGKKSLAYIVRPSEVKIGGRVLDHTYETETETEADMTEAETEDGRESDAEDDEEGGYSTPTYQESDAYHESDSESQISFSHSDATSTSDDSFLEELEKERLAAKE